MPVRMFAGDAAIWEPLVSLGILGATVVAIVLLASRLYAGSLMQMGSRVKLARAWAQAD
jgi:ABC-2 type transport system permease protein